MLTVAPSRAGEVRFARRFRIKRAWRQRFDECLFVPAPVPGIPEPADDDSRPRIPVRVRLDDRIRRNFRLDSAQARFRWVAEQDSSGDSRQSGRAGAGALTRQRLDLLRVRRLFT